ncbi:hypothetical protein AGMMS49965_19540 [Bacteroidia bacterium]|nr:hypothetical protein AGMMS49965_19540 [Bacteroidia bacterium]
MRIKYVLLGDLYLRIMQVENGEIIREEYLSMWILHHLYVWLHAHFNFTGYQTVKLADYIIGALFIFFSLCTANLLGNTFLKKAAAFVISTLSCTILLQLCGYNEIYAFALLFLQLYLFTSLLYLKDKIHIAVPTLILFAGIAFHLMLVCMLPSLIFLLYGKILWKRPFFKNKTTILGIVLVSLPFLYLAFQKFVRHMVLPLELTEGAYTLFSIAHFKEFFNSQLLGGGVGFLIWLMILIYSIVFKVKYNLTAWFFLIASLSIVGMMVVFNAGRGLGDWDIFAFAAVVFNLSNAGILLGGGVQEERICKNLKYGVLMFAGFSVLHTSAWLLLNKTDASLKWAKYAYETDPTHSDNAVVLGDVFYSNNLEEGLKWYEKSYSEGNHAAGPKYTLLLDKLGRKEEFLITAEKLYKADKRPLTAHNYAIALVKLDRKEEACAILEANIKEYPAYPPSYLPLIKVYIEKPDYDALYRVLVQMEYVYTQVPEEFTQRLTQEQLDGFWGVLAELRTMRAAGR